MTLRSAVGAAGLPLSSCTEKKATIEVRVLPAGGDGSVKPLRPMPSQLGATECIAQAARLDAFDPSARPLVTQLHGAPGSGPVGACTPADDAVGALAATLGAKIGGKPLELNRVGGAAVGAPSGLLACEPVRFAAIAAAAPSDPPSLRTGRACAGGSARATLAARRPPTRGPTASTAPSRPLAVRREGALRRRARRRRAGLARRRGAAAAGVWRRDAGCDNGLKNDL